jgi:LacI family transcriptional regulator
MKRSSQPTINDVARIAGVSKKTVSRVINQSPLLNGDTRKRVEEVIADLGYVPNPQARALALRRNFLIGLIHDNPNAQMVLNVQQGMLEVLRDTEFELIVHPVDRGSPTMLEDIGHFLERQRPFGVMILPPISENDQLAGLCAELGVRYVRMGSATLDEASHMVASNDREAVRGAVEHLIESGHRRIGLVLGPHGFRSALERQKGYEEAIERAGLPLQRTLIVQGDYKFEYAQGRVPRGTPAWVPAFLPATKAMPKEMLPVVDRPLIQYAVDEALEAGIEQMIFVTGRGKSRDRGPFRHRL